MIVAVFFVAHLIACIWYAVGLQGGDSGWVAYHGLQDSGTQTCYIWSLHWSLAQFSGEVIFMPQTITERGWAIFVMILTFIFSALFISSITTSMTRLLIVAGQQSQQLLALRRYLFSLRISASLVVRMQCSAQRTLLEQKKTAPDLLELISEPLRADFHYELHSPHLMAHPFFYFYNEVHPASIRRVCHLAVSSLSLSRGDVVFSDNEATEQPRMLFVLGAGRLMYRQDGMLPQSVFEGNWVCEHVLWASWVHCGFLCAECECQLLALDSETFRRIVSAVPTKHASLYATAFIEQLNGSGRAALSDLWAPDFEEAMDRAFPRTERPSNFRQRHSSEMRRNWTPGQSPSFGKSAGRLLFK